MYVDMLVKKAELNLNVTGIDIAITGGAPLSPQLAIDMIASFGIKALKVETKTTKKNTKMPQYNYKLQIWFTECVWYDGARNISIHVIWNGNNRTNNWHSWNANRSYRGKNN